MRTEIEAKMTEPERCLELLERLWSEGFWVKTDSIAASVTFETNPGLTATPYISSKCAWISRVLIPFA